MAGSLESTRSAISKLGGVSPALGARAALAVFFATRPRMPVHSDDLPTHRSARRGTVRVRGLDLVSYRWGSGAETVLLAHGWRGRASQFAPITRELVHAGLSVVAFDAPGHGDSPGRRTDVRDWLSAIDQLHRAHGRFRLLVGHSFGALAVLTASREGVSTGAVTTIAGAGTPVAFLDAFSRGMRLAPRVDARFNTAFRRRIGEEETSALARYDAVANPLPPGIELLAVHDETDRQVPVECSERLHAAHPDRSLVIRTRGLGHTRLLAADATLDTVTAFATGGLEAVDAASATRSDR